MGSCNFDHPLSDVVKKLEEQKTFLPNELYENSSQLLRQQQDVLNELFHLLKKYDLASEDVKEERNKGLKKLISQHL